MGTLEKTGNFRDGTILIKELVSVCSKSGVSVKGGVIGLEAAIKSTKYFPEEPDNWAYYSFPHRTILTKTATHLQTAACNSCPAAAAKDDFVFTKHYPVLRGGKGSGQQGIGGVNSLLYSEDPYKKEH